MGRVAGFLTRRPSVTGLNLGRSPPLSARHRRFEPVARATGVDTANKPDHTPLRLRIHELAAARVRYG